MNKKLYYTIEKELEDMGDGIEETTGFKTITVYTIEDNEPKLFFTLNLSNDDNTEEYIQNYLDDNGYGDDEWNFVQL